MKYDLMIRGGMVVDPANNFEAIADMGIKDGCIMAVEQELNVDEANRVVLAEGFLVMPGVVDSHVHVARPQAYGAGYRMLVKAGVTTAVDFEGPIRIVAEEIETYGCGMNIGVLEGMRPGAGLTRTDTGHKEVEEKVASSLEDGALGVKIIGGHYPLAPETTRDIIETASVHQAYVAFHAGTTATGSNILGMEEAVKLAGSNPLHIAHINAYCRGLIEDPLEENRRAMEALKKAPQLVSESHLALMNGCGGAIGADGMPESHVTRNCLRTFGYPLSREGVHLALKDGVAGVYAREGDEMSILRGQKGLQKWLEEKTRIGLSFPVNLRSTALICATEKREEGTFVVDAISSDGGAIPRNVILEHGMQLVGFGALTLRELVLKTSFNPAKMFGFVSKGHFSVGADADVILVEPVTGKVQMTFIDGTLSMANGMALDRPGKVLTTHQGAKELQRKKAPHRLVHLQESSFFTKGRKYPSKEEDS